MKMLQNRLADIPITQKESNLAVPPVNYLQPQPVEYAKVTARDSVYDDCERWAYAYAAVTDGTTNDVTIDLSNRTERFITFFADMPTAGQTIYIKDSSKRIIGALTAYNNRHSIPMQRRGLFYLTPPAAALNYVVISHDFAELI